MNLERGFSVPQEKGVVIQNGDVWIPATPEKPIVQRPNQVLVGMQQNQIGEENWQELIGIYSEVLRDEACSELPLECNPNSHVVLNQEELTIRDVAPAATYNKVPQNFRPMGLVGLSGGEHNVQDVAFVETCNRLLPQSSNSTGLVGMNHRNHNIQGVATVEKFRSFNQNDRSTGSYLQNIGDVVPPRKVNSLDELMGMRSNLNAPTTNGDRITFVVDKPTSIGPHSQVERNWKTYRPDSMTPLQNHILHANQDIGGFNLQQIPNSRLSVAYRPSYNLNLPPRSEAGESSSVARPLQLGPITPDQQKLLKSNQIIQVPHLSIDEISTKANNKQDNVVLPQHAEIRERQHNDFVYGTLGTSSAAISTPPKEKQNSDDGRNDGEIDLNKTPPQKTPKRRKHRPKVVVEGKPKRTPKPAARENNSTPSGNSSTKRKYERKKGIKTSTNQSIDAANEVEVSNVESQAKSCKRALNFDLENGVGKKIKGKEFDHQADNNEGSKVSFSLNSDFHNAELNGQSTSTVKDVHQNICRKQKQTENSYNFIHSANKIPPQESLPLAATVPTALKDRTLNVIARSLNVRNANINQSGSQGKYGQVHHRIGGELAQLVILANTREQNSDGKRQSKLQTRPQLLEDLVDVSEKQESKREYSHTELTQPLMGSQIWSHRVSGAGHYNRECRQFWQNGSGSSKTENVEDKITGRSSSMPSGKTTADCSEQIEIAGNKSFRAQSYKLHLNGGLPYFSSEGKSTSINSTSETNMVTHHWCMNSTDSGHNFQKQVNLYAEQMAHMAPHHFAKAQTTSSLTAVANCHLVSASHRDPKVTKGNEIIDAPAHVSVKRQAARQTPSKIMSSIHKELQQETQNLQGYGHDSKKVAGSREYKRNMFSIDDITDRMKDLLIGNNGKEIVEEEHNAIVPYRGHDAVVPFEVFDPIKKRRPRPKVDLDPETNRLWNLLMGKEGIESAQPMDNDKQKWWEEERKVFRGRVDSFIARMHLVQGDRRFSKWKGSVVDSVIGVFLTQNVSDHLSSSAFMSLAAKFPMKSTTIRETCCHNRGNPSKHEVLVRHPDETTSCHHQTTREQVYHHSSVKPSQLSEYGPENITSGKTFLINNHTRRTEEGMISSQSSSESVSFQTSEDIRSSSGSNSEAEDQVTGSSFTKNHGPLNLFEQVERIGAFQQYQLQEIGSSFPDNRPSHDHQQTENLVYRENPELASGRNVYSYPFTTNMLHHQKPVPSSTNSWQKMLMDMEQRETDVLAFLGKECTSSLTSTQFDTTNGTGIEHAHDKAGQSAESSLTDQQTGSSKFQPSTVNHEVLNKHLEQQMNLPTESESTNGQHFINYRRGIQGTFQQESIFLTDPVKSAEAFRQKPSDDQKPSENITLESSEMKTMHASNVQSSKISTTSNTRKRKAEKEKVEPFNWDTLRKQVLSKAGTRGRSRDTLDSLDYKALRNADVHEISQTIKERGMNNMLAERIKDFLNRLVRDHGGVDLEWLRDVQPDKAKDYLLSIRGLGLKSVECVRLLTLHHLAFPVDTNVGRIAVRLGWVPLQPLPESLQLHLLELYPVLESIQKYLWPRLCMLDQETLYELHYQLITFGKVFCTKRQPNCNACPMKGECRHFASAFASARLALPGPEERRIVCSDVPTTSSKSCGVVIKPMPLPPTEDNLGREPGYARNCEPIIEEPTTPESSIEVSERDIEDAFYEDPDEIPVIKLNIEEFTTNLQSFIQEKMEMQEGDMSKALVALSPKLASIPIPKLKHVSRLRTEHQVYELPDSHPLLKELDRREPDDPSPYLLAIWTPGETADSVQPPESKCSSSKGGLCNTKTCFSCNSTRGAQAQTVRGTILIPCRTAMRGSFPLNGTYFQVNEVFADHETSMNPIDVPRSLIWNLPRRTVFFGTSVSTIFKGMSTEGIQYCFWKGFVCVRGFDQKTRAPRPLMARLHLPASKIAKQNE